MKKIIVTLAVFFALISCSKEEEVQEKPTPVVETNIGEIDYEGKLALKVTEVKNTDSYILKGVGKSPSGNKVYTLQIQFPTKPKAGNYSGNADGVIGSFLIDYPNSTVSRTIFNLDRSETVNVSITSETLKVSFNKVGFTQLSAQGGTSYYSGFLTLN